MTTEQAKYIFCITEAGPPSEFGAGGVHTIPYRDLAAVVRDAPSPFPPPSREDLVTHLRVIEQVMESRTVIPMGFGTVVASEQEVREGLLACRYQQLRALLEGLTGKVELGLKVLWRDVNQVFQEILAEQERVRTLRDWLIAHPEADTPQHRIEVGQMVADALEEKKRQEGEEIVGELAPLASGARPGRLLGDRMVLNAAFLVERRREGEFDWEVARLGEARGQRLLFKYVGPAPPFNFVDLECSAVPPASSP